MSNKTKSQSYNREKKKHEDKIKQEYEKIISNFDKLPTKVKSLSIMSLNISDDLIMHFQDIVQENLNKDESKDIFTSNKIFVEFVLNTLAMFLVSLINTLLEYTKDDKIKLTEILFKKLERVHLVKEISQTVESFDQPSTN